MVINIIEEQAKLLAAENRKLGPDIEKVYWFPDEEEVRLVELTEQVPRAQGGEVEPYYFLASPSNQLPAPSGIAMIRPEEFGKLRLPDEWGDWDRAVLLEVEHTN